MRLILSFLVLIALSLPAVARPPLREVAEIDNGLMALAIADEIRKRCDGINARMIKAMGRINGLKSQAKALGYSDAEIDSYVTSNSEKARMRAKAESYLGSKGVQSGDTEALCAFGRAEMARATAIGSLLR